MSSDEEHSDAESERESEAAAALKKRRAGAAASSAGLDDAARELLEANRQDREKMEQDIKQLKERNKKRKKQREEYEKKMADQKKEEEERRKAEMDEKKKKKEEEDQKKQSEKAKKNAELEKLKDTSRPNFIITRKEGGEGEEGKGRKSREQLDAEKKAILGQRIAPLKIDGFDNTKLKGKAEELHEIIYRLEGDKYDLEKRFKAQQADMNELSDRARSAVKVGKSGLKRVKDAETLDLTAARFVGTPAKIEMFSKYERQKDKRNYGERKTYWSGPQFKPPAARIPPTKGVKWGESGLPEYFELGGGAGGEHGHEAQEE